MASWQIWLLVLAGIVALGFGILWFNTKPEKPYIGYGWKLGWRDGHVYVLSRLLKSPAGRAGVRIGSRVRTYAGHEMNFESAIAFREFMENLVRPEPGASATFCLSVGDTEETITMVAEKIFPPIPYYPPLPPLDPSRRHLVNEGMFYCTLTGQIVPTRSVSYEALIGE